MNTLEHYGTMGSNAETWIAVYKTLIGGMRCPDVVLGEKDSELVRNFAECMEDFLRRWGIEPPAK